MLTVIGALYSSIWPRRRRSNADRTEVRPLGSRQGHNKKGCDFRRNTDELRTGPTHAILTTKDRLTPAVSLFLWAIVMVLAWMYSDFSRLHLSCVRHPLESFSKYHQHEDTDCVLKGPWGSGGMEQNFELSGVRLVEPARLHFNVLMRKNGPWFNKEVFKQLSPPPLQSQSDVRRLDPQQKQQQQQVAPVKDSSSIRSNAVRRRLWGLSADTDEQEVNRPEVKTTSSDNKIIPFVRRRPHAAALLRQAKTLKANRARASAAAAPQNEEQHEQSDINQSDLLTMPPATYTYSSGIYSTDTKYAVELQSGGETKEVFNLGSFRDAKEAEAYRAEVQAFLERSFTERGLVRLELSVDPGRSVRVAILLCVVLAISANAVAWKQTTRLDAITDLVTIEVSTLCGLVTSRVVVPLDHIVCCVCVAKQAMSLRLQGRMDISSQVVKAFRVYLETEDGERIGLHLNQSMSDGAHARALEQAIQDELRRVGSRKTPRGRMSRSAALAAAANGFGNNNNAAAAAGSTTDVTSLRSRQQLLSNQRSFSVDVVATSRATGSSSSDRCAHSGHDGTARSTRGTFTCNIIGSEASVECEHHHSHHRRGSSVNDGDMAKVRVMDGCGAAAFADETTAGAVAAATTTATAQGPADVEASCVVCLSRPPQVALLPCRHVCTCTKCAGKVDACPVCRETIKDRMTLYIV